jgi:hypothetical protein
MTVQTASVEIVEVDASPSGRQAKELVEALADFAKSRSTRELIRSSGERQVRCALRVPLLKDGHAVRSAELGRVLRKVIRSAVGAASAGDHVIVDFIIASSSRLEIKAGPVAEMGGSLDGSTIDQFFRA